MKYFMTSASALALALSATSLAAAQDRETGQTRVNDEIIITATKRETTIQDAPVTVAALGENTLEELRVEVFTDYLIQLPGVTAGGSGPGQNTIYIRGVASTTPNLTTAGVAGLAPNVAFYLDEQPLAQPGRNLDVYAADLERIEVLSGPQGTLFGASSQAGTVRLITNKPVLGEVQANVKAGLSFTEGGDMSYNAEAVYNAPVSENIAVRGVVYFDRAGGYVDNVPGTVNMSESARYRQAGTVRANGVPVSFDRSGFSTRTTDANGNPISVPVDFSGANLIDADNSALVEDNINDTDYFGFRASALWEINNDWSLLVAGAHQEMDSDGVFYSDPNLDGDYDVQLYEETNLEDDFDNINWTLEGRVGALEALYTGAFTKRTTEQRVDYTDYLYVAQYLPYYICDYYNAYFTVFGTDAGGNPQAEISGTCQAPNLFVTSDTDTEVMTHELRFNTPAENRLRGTFGGFYSDLVLKERNDFRYPGSEFITYGPYPDNFRFPGPGYSSDDGAFPDGTIFRNDVRRTDKQMGVFGEATFDFTDQFALTLGARYYNIEVGLEGTANSSFCNLFSGTDRNRFGTDINDLYDGDGSITYTRTCNDALVQTFTLNDSLADIEAALGSPSEAQRVFNELRAPDKAEAEGVIFKATGTYQPNSDLLFYATYSQGFRPGLLNRPGGAVGPGGFNVPFELDTDDVDNYELGWKTDLFDNQLRFNGAAFFVDITNLQTTIFDPNIVNLFFSANAANAEVMGVEGDLTWRPYNIEGLTVSGAFSFLDTEITEVLLPTNDVQAGDTLAYAPEFQGNIRARYEWDVGQDLTAHVMPQIVHSSEAFSDIIVINRDEVQSWTTLGLSAGITADNWAFEVYGDNLTNEQNEIARNFVNDRQRVTYGRPLTIGARVSYRLR